MNDRELLEAAARAAGIEVLHMPLSGFNIVSGLDSVIWNPLADNGQALWLAVKLRLDVRVGTQNHAVTVGWGAGLLSLQEIFDDDPYAATRRAIVRAAASLQDPQESRDV